MSQSDYASRKFTDPNMYWMDDADLRRDQDDDMEDDDDDDGDDSDDYMDCSQQY